MEEIPFKLHFSVSMLMDRKRALRGARHVIDTKSFGKAFLHVQQVCKHLLGKQNIVTDGFKDPQPCAFPAGLIAKWVRLRH